jgi:L-alanine-DL-glutamate epimerase-like enolase superfamily enzyme
MKITDVTLTLFAAPPPPQGGVPGNLGLLRLHTNHGVEGHSFLGSLDNPAAMDGPQLIRLLKPALMGQDPLQREALYQRMRPLTRAAGFRAVGAVDVALWDLAGRVAGLPIHQLLGSFRATIPAYACSQFFNEQSPYLDQAQQLQQQGWQAFKIHPPKRPKLDIAIAEALRAMLGDDYPLMLDGGWRYSYGDAIKIGHALERLDYLWFEDPLGDEDIYNYVKLRQKLDIPIMATEFPSGGLDTYPIWITERATDILRGDIPVKGGITTMIKTAHLAEAFGMRYEVHYSGNSLSDIAGLHVAMAISNCTYFEMLFPNPVHSYGLVQPLAIDADGLLHAPIGPGLGVEIDMALITRHTEAVLS